MFWPSHTSMLTYSLGPVHAGSDPQTVSIESCRQLATHAPMVLPHAWTVQTAVQASVIEKPAPLPASPPAPIAPASPPAPMLLPPVPAVAPPVPAPPLLPALPPALVPPLPAVPLPPVLVPPL